MTFAPLAPTIRVAPEEIAPGTFVIHSVQEALGQPLFVYLNSMVILGAEPMIVDTGTIANREQWLDDVFSIVEPEDVRWIFLSHDDVDHSGNLDETLSACPNARLVCNWATIERHTNCFNFPLDRCQWVMDGDTLDIGDRTLVALRPPVFDSPTTRGLYDPTTGVYWAVDTFATPLPDYQIGVADLDPGFYEFAHSLFALGAVSPWLSIVDPVKFAPSVDRLPRARHHDGCGVPHPRVGRADDRARILAGASVADDRPAPDAGPVGPRPDRGRERATFLTARRRRDQGLARPSRSSSALVTIACTDADRDSSSAKSAPNIANTTIGVAALTVAVRRVVSSTAASPKKSPGPSSATTSSPCDTSAVPDSMMKRK